MFWFHHRRQFFLHDHVPIPAPLGLNLCNFIVLRKT